MEKKEKLRFAFVFVCSLNVRIVQSCLESHVISTKKYGVKISSGAFAVTT